MALSKWKVEVIPHDCEPFTVYCQDYEVDAHALHVLIKEKPCTRKHFPLPNICEITATQAES